jgi:chromosome partitioning protein
VEVLAIVNQKGGVGKTNVAANLGACLAGAGRAVVLIDADPQSTLTKMLLPATSASAPGTANVFVDDALPIDQLLVDVPDFGVRLLSADFERLDEVQSTLMRDPTRLFGLAQCLAALDGKVDYVLIDCPPNYGQLTTAALYASTGAIIPIDCSREAVGGLSLLLRTLRRVATIKPVPVHAVVATCFKSGNTFHPEIVGGVRDFLSDTPVFTIRDAIDVQRAVSRNKPIRSFAPKNGATIDYEGLASAVDAKLYKVPMHVE